MKALRFSRNIGANRAMAMGLAMRKGGLGLGKATALFIPLVFLAIGAFSLSLVGTFLVRSGVLTSVHAFAVDPTRGVLLLIILAALLTILGYSVNDTIIVFDRIRDNLFVQERKESFAEIIEQWCR